MDSHTNSADTVIAYGTDGATTSTDFWRRVDALGKAIAPLEAERFALVCSSTLNFTIAALALAHAGRTVIVPPAPQAGSLAACDAHVDLVVTDQPEDFSDYTTLSPVQSLADTNGEPKSPDDAAPIEFFTSGSGSRPSCIRQHFLMLRQEMGELEREWGDAIGNSMFIGTVPHHHRFGFLVKLLWPLMTGRAFHTDACLTPTALRIAVGERPCTIVSSPAFLGHIVEGADLPPPAQVRMLFSSGAPLPDAVAERLQQRWGRAATEIYGSTETGGIAWREWAGHEQRPRWQPLKHAKIELRPEAAGSRLWVRTPYTDGWVPSGDLARADAHDGFVLMGRADGVIKLADKRLSLDEMQRRLVSHPWVDDARLTVLHGQRDQLGAVVILSTAGHGALDDSGKAATSRTLRDWLREVYEPVLIPRKWRFIAAWPRNEMGKVTREFLHGLFALPGR